MILDRIRNMDGSLSARRAWIEISELWSTVKLAIVALRKESVDRNCNRNGRARKARVALRKESVDRNPPVDTSSVKVSLSLSARRAWIEITSERLRMPSH